MAGRIAPPARPPSGLTYFINVAPRLSHLCIDAVNGSDRLPLLKISQTRRPGPPLSPIKKEAPIKQNETIRNQWWVSQFLGAIPIPRLSAAFVSTWLIKAR
jgi:hypothetical protein